MFNLKKILKNADPEKVRLVFQEVYDDETMPEEARATCKKVLDALDKKMNTGSVMDLELKKGISNMKREIKQTIKTP